MMSLWNPLPLTSRCQSSSFPPTSLVATSESLLQTNTLPPRLYILEFLKAKVKVLFNSISFAPMVSTAFFTLRISKFIYLIQASTDSSHSSYQFYWGKIDKTVRYLKCTVWRSDIHCKRILPIGIIYTPHLVTFFKWEHFSSTLRKFQLYNNSAINCGHHVMY